MGTRKRSMQVWVDGDACPNEIKKILYRAADRVRVQTTVVSNQPLNVPKSDYISMLQVPGGFDVADNRIVELMDAGDLVITADIPLAADVVEKGGVALNPRGTLYTADNVQDRLAMRNLMDQLRSTGTETGGPNSFGAKEKQAFANQLDRYLSKHHKP